MTSTVETDQDSLLESQQLSLAARFTRNLQRLVVSETLIPRDYAPEGSQRIQITVPNAPHITVSALLNCPEKPKVIVPFPSGMKGVLAGYKNKLERFQRNDIAYLAVPLPFPEHTDDFYAVYQSLIEYLIGNPNSEVHQIARNLKIPIMPFFHSTSGGVYNKLAAMKGETPFKRTILESGNILTPRSIAPFGSAANASPLHEKFNQPRRILGGRSTREAFIEHASRYPDAVYGDHILELIAFTLPGRLISGQTQVLARELMPAYGVILELMKHGEGTQAQLDDIDPESRAILANQLILLNMKDRCSCSHFTQSFADAVGAEVREVEATPNHTHNPLEYNMDALDLVIKEIIEEADIWHAERIASEERALAAHKALEIAQRQQPQPPSIIDTVVGWFGGKKKARPASQELAL